VFSVQAPGDGGAAEPPGRVPLEDGPDDRCGALVRDQLLALVAGIAEGEAAVRPAPFPRAALDAAGYAVNDNGVLELGEHAKHLQHHPPRGGAGVERLGRGAQDHAELVQLLGDLAHLAR